jgi:hypothetical protein
MPPITPSREYAIIITKEKRLTSSESVKEGVQNYSTLHREKTLQERNASYASLVNHYYDLATVFYEWVSILEVVECPNN